MRAVLAGIILSLTLCAPSFAQSQPLRVRGQIVSLDGNVLTVKTAAATTKITLNDGFTVVYLVKGDLSKIAPGSYVGTAAIPQPDGTLRALELQIFNDTVKPPDGHQAWDSVPGSTMTNATISQMASTTVDKVDGRMLVLKYKDGEQRVFVPTNVPRRHLRAGRPQRARPRSELHHQPCDQT